MSAPDFVADIEAIARRLLGEPNMSLSSRTQWRYGTNGSLAVEIAGDARGTWYDHEAGTGGGVIDLVARHCNGQRPADWLRAEGFVPQPQRRIVTAYDYTDEIGTLLFQVVRYEPKTFRQRRPGGNGGWDWSVKGVRQVPYRLEDLAARPDEHILVEGEKDADRLSDLGLLATCNAGGAMKWGTELSRYLAGRVVHIIPDDDGAGRKHAEDVARKLAGVAASVRIVNLPGLPEKGDVSDWLANGGTAALPTSP